jgi:hypothetical protein
LATFQEEDGVIDAQAVADIRQKYYGEHWAIGTIAAELGLHHDTVERALERDGPRPEPPPRPSQLDDYVDFIRETLQKHPRLRATRVHQMLRVRGCTASARQVRRKVATLRPTPREAFLRRRTFAGEEGLCGIPHRPSYAASGNMRRPPKAIR